MILNKTTSRRQGFGWIVTSGTFLALTVVLVAATPDRPSASLEPSVDLTDRAIAPAPDVEVLITEYKIEMPASVVAGEITFVVRNGGTEEHSLKIARGDWEASLEGNLGPGDTDNFTVTLEAGTYEVTCPLSDDVEKVRLEVTAG